MVKKETARGKPAPAPKAGAKHSSRSATGGGGSGSGSGKAATTAAAVLPLPVQQALLDVFAATFNPVLRRPDFTTRLQAVKGALFRRDFAVAFPSATSATSASRQTVQQEDDSVANGIASLTVDDNNPLAVYAARWSPPRALGYASAILGPVVRPHLDSCLMTCGEPTEAEGGRRLRLRMLTLGGGAAEIGCAAMLLRQSLGVGATGAGGREKQAALFTDVDLTLVDAADWHDVVTALQGPLQIFGGPLPGTILPRFIQRDVLEADVAEMTSWMAGSLDSRDSRPLLITLFFTLNELYTASGLGKTTTLLLTLTAAAPVGSLLLVIDSPGSYSEAAVGGTGSTARKESGGNPGRTNDTKTKGDIREEERDTADDATGKVGKRKYPMHWVLDYTLREKTREAERVEETPSSANAKSATRRHGPSKWERLESHESLWFRLSPELKYPIALENMRYQLHLYRRLGS